MLRGGIPPLFTDRVELTIARRELEAGATELEAAIALEDKRERSEKVKVAIAHLSLAARALDEICDRRSST